MHGKCEFLVHRCFTELIQIASILSKLRAYYSNCIIKLVPKYEHSEGADLFLLADVTGVAGRVGAVREVQVLHVHYHTRELETGRFMVGTC